jgi:beta-galactosidase
VGDAAVLYSTDGAGLSYLRCGKIEGVYATVDFGTGKKLFFFLCSFMLSFVIIV